MASAAAQQQRWQAWYSSAEQPWDTRRPGSQLVAYITQCKDIWSQHLQPTQLSPTVKADVWLPPQYETVQSPVSTLQTHACGTCHSSKPPPGGTVLEIGCGTGSSSVWLAQQGYQVIAVDLIPAAVRATRSAAAAAGVQNKLATLQMNVFDLPANLDFETARSIEEQQAASNSTTSSGEALAGVNHTEHTPGTISLPAEDTTAAAAAHPLTKEAALANPGTISMIYDSQTFHVLCQIDEQRLLLLLTSLLVPGGIVFLLAGNAGEAGFKQGNGPPLMTQQELLSGCLEAGLKLRQMVHTRFDETHYYKEQLGRRPLAWCAVLQKPTTA